MTEVEQAQLAFARRAVAAGMARYTPDGRIKVPGGAAVKISPGEAAAATQAARESVAAHTELDADEGARSLTVRRRDGSRVTLRIVITAGSERWERRHRKRIAALTKQYDESTDDEELDRLDTLISQEQDALMRRMIPDLPDGLVEELTITALTHLHSLIGGIFEEIIGTEKADPNAGNP